MVAKPKARRQKLAHNLSVSQSPTVTMVDEDRIRGKEVASILRVLRIYRRTNSNKSSFGTVRQKHFVWLDG